ncbi:Flavin-dependent monooxygenase-2C oxygenase subunit HsaA [Mariniflexile rhizosphaerae]|uniref:acyl-CoA dehydrogenase n=1 Tax=unclassified Mariniflexile TaxID=2643887 RepID=UPI000CB1423B|nr:acyl-CoA dehydrogenase [Mariniflexile sp. TRM1-10]AXP81755.1 Flavin-dependent monooxygenase-2C oxygenase subunit HsaA [Mariniflexile sp. TRM1-10]PLB20863.1 MAG: Acyl-CoA dehydrogenase, type 2, C-terminal domain [Flavobacteriaceae bacterium FS1-H7996/R]
MHIKQSSLLEAPVFTSEVLAWITKNNLWNIWVPKAYNGLELSLTEGLQKLQGLAKTDGSLGWTVTLCSGANYFIGNLQPETRSEIFLSPKKSVCFGGSGGVFGTAEQQGDTYSISGEWHYATGAPYLTHFTLNAKIIADGDVVLNDDGTPLVYSFVIPKEAVSIIENRGAMGLKATATHSFQVNSAVVSSKYAFVYNTFYLPQPIFKIPFSVFADLTLWVNYLGMAEHYLEEAATILEHETLEPFYSVLLKTNQQLYKFAEHIELLTTSDTVITEAYIETIHATASASVKEISKAILNIYPLLGVKACSDQHVLNRIFRDYFTATQHHNFSGR